MIGIQGIQRLDQSTRISTNSDGKVLDLPVNLADVNVGLNNTESLDLAAVDDADQLWILNEESGEALVDQSQSVFEGVAQFDCGSDVLDQNLNGGLVTRRSALCTLVQCSRKRTRTASSDCDDLLSADNGGCRLDFNDSSFQITEVSPITDVQELDGNFDLRVLDEENLERVPDFDQNFVFRQGGVLNNLDLSRVDPLLEGNLDVDFQGERKLVENLQQEAVFSLCPARAAVCWS